MPAFIGLPGAREKTESGRGLFERSEFRSPRRRAKREAGIPDNQRATFLGYFFAAGKKLRNTVILTTAGRKNLYPSISEASLSNDKNPSVYEKSPAKCYYSRRILSFRTAGR